VNRATPPRDEDTQQLIKRFRGRRARRRRLAIVLTIIAIIIVVGGGATALALTLSNHSTDLAASTTGPGGGTTAAQDTPASLAQAGPTVTSTSQTGTIGGGSPARATTTAAGVTTTAAGAITSGPGGATTTATSTSTTAKRTTTSQPTTSTTHASTTTTGAVATAASAKVVVIDPGHQAKADNSPEPIGPGSSITKPKVASGTAGVVTGVPESKLALAVGLKLRDSLAAHGIKVVMTRTTQNVNISNSQRAQIANKAHADLFVRIHADGSTDHSTHGIHVLYPASIKAGPTISPSRPRRRRSWPSKTSSQPPAPRTGASTRGAT